MCTPDRTESTYEGKNVLTKITDPSKIRVIWRLIRRASITTTSSIYTLFFNSITVWILDQARQIAA